MANKKKVMVIGWDAADWKVIYKLMKQGKMPTLAKFLDEGTHGKIKTLDPPLSPMLWTSIATGFRADKHGILGFVEPTPDGGALRPVTSTSRKVKALWNILGQEGYKSNVVGWWPSNPAEPINGCMVSNLYQTATKPADEEWPMVDGTVHPERLKDRLAELRVHPSEITKEILLPFVPKFQPKDLESEKDRLWKIAKILAEASGVHAASTFLQETEEWDFMAVYHDAIDHWCHLCMKFHPPQMPGVPDNMFEMYKNVVEAGYMFHDMMLERSLELCDDDTTVIIVSDHGFHSDHLRPMRLPKEPAAPAREHNPYGIFAIKGPNIKKGQQILGASVIDIAPTVLACFGLPVGEDMEGNVLSQVFETPVDVKYIPSWEEVEGETGQHQNEEQVDPWAAKEAMKQLVELGYIEAPDGKMEDRIKELGFESQYYVARNHADAGRFAEAAEILTEIFAETEINRYGQRLAMAHYMMNEFGKCQEVIDKIAEINKRKLASDEWEAQGEEVTKRFSNPEVEVPNFLDFVQGLLHYRLQRYKKALEHFNRVIQANKSATETFFFKGQCYMRMGRWEEAKEPFIQALAINEHYGKAHYGLGLAFLRTNMLEEAAEEFLSAIEINYKHASSHYYLGEVLVKMERFEDAVAAFNVAISISPGMAKAHEWLKHLYTEKLNDVENAQKHQKFMEENIKETIVVVSGLPRSGTSMMMQMLDNGGKEILTDGVREADNSNPKGYYEFEKVKSLAANNTWMPEAEGKVVKVITQLISHLPPGHNYKIVYMERDIAEVLTSQQVMLGKTKDVAAKAFPTGLDKVFKQQVAKMDTWVEAQPHIEILRVKYKDVIEDPASAAVSVTEFLGEDLDVAAMVEAVDGKLYRNKLSK